jgi:hypothetical protein
MAAGVAHGIVWMPKMKSLMIEVGVWSAFCGMLLMICGMVLASGTFSTRYAPGYSESGFRRIRIGMETNEVLKVAGKPLLGPGAVKPGQSSYWLYTTCNDNFWTYKRRWLRVIDGTVVEIISGVAED